MAAGVLMPKAGITVEECMITRWEKKIGDRVNIGDILFTYETDKASFECESTAEGELLEIFFNEGDDVPVLVNVCAVGEKGEDVSSLRPGAAAPAPKEAPEKTADAVPTADVPLNEQHAKNDGELKISPRARNLAEKSGVDAYRASPTGPYGRIVERDIVTLIDSGTGSGIGGRVLPGGIPAASSGTASAPVDGGEYEDVAFTKIRQVIAKSMTNSLATIPQLTHHHSFDATNILEFRRSIKASAEKLGLPNITLNDIILYAVSRTLIKFPNFNAHVTDGDKLRRFRHVHLGVAMDTPRGLMVPTIFNADQKSLTEISAEAKALAKQAQAGSVSPDVLQGGTFTVSNLGSLGVEMFTPVINAPQTAILGVCNLVTRFRMTDGEAKPYQAMGLSVTYDHRVIDGAPEARFAMELISYLENFTAMLVE